MIPPEREALDRILELAQQQVEMLSDVTQRPDTHPAELGRHCFELLVQAMATHAARLQQDGTLPAPTRKRCQSFVAAAERYRASSINVAHALLDLAEDWSCSACHKDVPAGASITGVTSGPAAIKVELRCKACGRSTVLGREGRKRFQKAFGHLANNPLWNPEANGFTWDHR